MHASENKLPALYWLERSIEEMIRALSRLNDALGRSREKAMLYRLRSGDKPYDVSLPRDRWVVLSANRRIWM